MLNSNEPMKIAQRQKLANQSVLNGALAINFAKYQSFLEVQKNSKVVNA